MLKLKTDIVELLKRSGCLLGSLAFVTACAPGGSGFKSNQTEVQRFYTIIEQELTPTIDEEIRKQYKPSQPESQQKIINQTAKKEILIDQLKLEKTRIKYDTASGLLQVFGTAKLVDEKGQKIQSTEFELNGEHAPNENVFFLKSDKVKKVNSNESLVIRGKATCLNQFRPDQFDCTKVVIDFFGAYKGQIYTEQMELIDSTKPAVKVSAKPTSPSPTESKPDKPESEDEVVVVTTKPENVATEDDDYQAEGPEPAIVGRYQGHAETVDLTQLFEDDEAQIEKETPVAAAKSSSSDTSAATAKPGTSSSSGGSQETPPKSSGTTTAPSVPTDKTPIAKPAKPIGKDTVQLSDGTVRPVNQAVGRPDEGRLRNSTSILTKQELLDKKAYFQVANPKNQKFYGTFEASEIIVRLGENHYSRSGRKLFVGNLSKKSGGPVNPHASHQNGTDIDFAYPSELTNVNFPTVVQMKNKQYNLGAISIDKTFELFKFAFKQKDIKVDRIFSDKRIIKSLCDFAKSKNELTGADKDIVKLMFESIDHVDGHGDHFHLRLKCSSYDPQCRQMLYRVNPGCK